MKLVNKMMVGSLIVTSLTAASIASAAGTVIVKCGDSTGELTQINIVKNPNGKMIAVMQVESFGGSYPTYKIPVEQLQVNPHRMGTPFEYVGKDFDLQIMIDTAPRHDGAILSHLKSSLSSVSTIYCKVK